MLAELSTGTGVSSQFVYMRVVEPRAIIVGGDLHVQRGSSIRLVCVIEQSPTPPKYVFWFHHNRMVNYDTHRGGINVTTTPGAKTLSRLTITDAQESDSGNYTCAAPNTTPDSAGVFVYYGDNTAAIQRRKSSGAWSLMVTTHFLLVASTSLLTSLVSFLVPPADSAPDPPSVRSESDPTTKAADETISHQRAEESSVTFQIAVPDWSR
ncbi:uncharacterized protein LOC143023833 [Oratosquilla oratoria]|uniref:uncharacterized protein LOC143023833 n=1 Tax=Oratosquilla oratoria TaxID=337810 RepID=UPI003F7775A9